MRSVAIAAAIALGAGSQAAHAQIFPGEGPAPTAFPSAFSFSLLAAFAGDLRVTHTYVDSAAACLPCTILHSTTGTMGLAVRYQMPIGPRTGVRFGATISGPKRKRRDINANQVLVESTRLRLFRGEMLLMFKLKPQVPIYFGVGGSVASFSPGPLAGQQDITELGGAAVIGVDKAMGARVATRFEWTLYGTKPKTTGLNSEFVAEGLALDSQMSFGVNLYLRPKPPAP